MGGSGNFEMGASQRIANALACAGLLCCGAGAIAASPPSRYTVVIDGLKFGPETVKVRRGDIVTWVNKDPFPHTVTAKGVFDSHEIPANGSWKYTARKPGRYSYICTLHSNMRGTLMVE
jgi:plastocyanin